MLVHEEVRTALDEGRPVVALESTIIAHGLPRPDNLRVAREIEGVVRERGAVPATIAILGGEVRIGLDDAALEVLANTDGVAKCGVRDLAPVVARGGNGATTVAATSHLAERAGIRVFATGGLGGVHRGAHDSFDESADLGTLARVGICVVCAGVKSILDIPATLERLETLNVTVLGYRTDTFPAFYLNSSGLPVTWRVDTPAEAAEVLRQRSALGAPGAVIVANPLPLEEQLDPELHDRVLREGLQAAAEQGIAGRDVTPFLLERFHTHTGGESLRANVRLVLRNAALAAEIAAA
jgi:pseudouridine-5'-phosphate glycosidase